MTTPAHTDIPSRRQPGRLGRALIRLLMKPARIVEAESIADAFRLITLESPGFKGLDGTPGQKLQIAMGSAFVARTFTPIEWDAARGRIRLLGYIHGNGPGSAWVRDGKPGDACDVFGPRASLDAGRAGGTCVVLGDETSIGLACALSRHTRGSPAHCLLEVNDPAQVDAVLARLALDGVERFERTEHDAHLEQIEQRLTTLAAGTATFILTGRAPAIQRLRRALKNLGVPGNRLLTKPYWAPGKTGLD